MAAFGRYSFNNADIHQEQIEIMGHNTGFETGIVATQLIKKVALSSSFSFEKAFDNKPDYIFPTSQSDIATNYTLSLGRLMYPKKYTNYKQTSINTMVEFVGQTLKIILRDVRVLSLLVLHVFLRQLMTRMMQCDVGNEMVDG